MVAMLRGGVREVKVPEPPGAEGLENGSLRVSARTPVTSARFTGKQVLSSPVFQKLLSEVCQ